MGGGKGGYGERKLGLCGAEHGDDSGKRLVVYADLANNSNDMELSKSQVGSSEKRGKQRARDDI